MPRQTGPNELVARAYAQWPDIVYSSVGQAAS